MKNTKVEIVTIGDEILIGQIVDTNSTWMATELNKVGFEVAQITSIHDDADLIINALNEASLRADIVLMTGGIGPTKDDLTKQTLCRYFDTRLVFSDSVYQNIENILSHRSMPINELTKAQALVPEKCTVIQNRLGTAPVTWFEKEGKIVVSMPGVPYEMKGIMSSEIIPRLKTRFETDAILHKTVMVYGYGESALAIKIEDWENSLPENMHLAYLPAYGIVRLRLSGVGEDMLALDFKMNQYIGALKDILGDTIISDEDISTEKLIGNLLKERNLTLSTAESCTGGNIAQHITSVPGSSAYFNGSVVAYSNDVKIKVLHVNADDIEKEGAVSQPVVEQMAQNVRQLLKTDIAVATSGIAGPDGGTAEKPVGTVWIAVCDKDKVVSRKFTFSKERDVNIERATQAALMMIRELILNK